MFENWSEHQRRWFLTAFCATAWLLLANSLAGLGRGFAGGGIGPDAFHAVGLVGTFAGWVVIWSAFHLSLTRWVSAVLFGVALNVSLVDFGFRDQVAAGLWSGMCSNGEGAACQSLAAHYSAGRSPLHGWLDAVPLYVRACRLGGFGTSASCHTSERMTPDPDMRHDLEIGELSMMCFEGLSSEKCMVGGDLLERRSQTAAAYLYYAHACELARPGSAPHGCLALLDTGRTDLRARACERIDSLCPTSSSRQCEIAEQRCLRIRSPYAGTD